MRFCPKCKSIMIYKGNKAVCRKCGYEVKVKNDDIVIISKCKSSSHDIPIIEEDVSVLPTTNIICPKCGNNKAYWWMRQLRAADESEVRFYKCTKCGNVWREYD